MIRFIKYLSKVNNIEIKDIDKEVKKIKKDQTYIINENGVIKESDSKSDSKTLFIVSDDDNVYKYFKITNNMSSVVSDKNKDGFVVYMDSIKRDIPGIESVKIIKTKEDVKYFPVIHERDPFCT